MKNGGGQTSTSANVMRKFLQIIAGLAVVCLLLLAILLLINVLGTDQAVSSPPATGQDEVPAISSDEPSVQLEGVVGSNLVPSIQWAPSAGSFQFVQGGAGVTISDIGLLQLKDLKVNEELPGEWRNILVLGSDSRDMETLSLFDTIMIASIHKTTGELKLTSILRDTVVPVAGRGLQRINTTAFYGGPSLTMQTINQNFGMNITEYVLVNFAGMAKLIDALGGITLDIDDAEMKQINRSMGQIAKYTMSKDDYLARREAMKIKAPGNGVAVNGIQAVSYARIRRTDSDTVRSGRQRLVISRILKRMQEAGTGQLLTGAVKMWGDVVTNISMMDAISLAKAVVNAGEKQIVPEFVIPYAKTRQGAGGSLVDVDLAANALQLRNFIYASPNP